MGKKKTENFTRIFSLVKRREMTLTAERAVSSQLSQITPSKSNAYKSSISLRTGLFFSSLDNEPSSPATGHTILSYIHLHSLKLLGFLLILPLTECHVAYYERHKRVRMKVFKLSTPFEDL